MTSGLTASVISATEFGLIEDVRAAKASLLYADEVKVFSSRAQAMATFPEWWEIEDPRQLELISVAAKLLEVQFPDDPQLIGPEVHHVDPAEDWGAMLQLLGAHASDHIDLMPQKATTAATLVLMMEGWKADELGIPVVDPRSLARLEAFAEHSLKDLFPGLFEGESSEAMRSLDLREGFLVRDVLGSLTAYPEADWDVIVDVRDRTADARTRLRGAIADAAQELDDVPVGSLQGVAANVRRRLIEPALVDMDDELESLKVKDTLLRIAGDSATLAATGTTLAIVASVAAQGALSPETLLGAVPGIAAGVVKEASFRNETRRKVSANPLWLLHQGRRMDAR